MIVYPAIDLRGGKVVRLQEGDPNRQTTFSDDPVATAQRWINAGAEWLHVVNLDGAFDTQNDNLRVLEQITMLGTPVQFGGGLRDAEQIARALDLGAARVVLGTLAARQPEAVSAAIERHGAEAICVGLDARDDTIVTDGWQQSTGQDVVMFGQAMSRRGVRHALFTDVSRDGQLTGVNVTATAELARQTSLQVIASGGVSGLGDVAELAASRHVAGVIIGMALYTGHITLPAAIETAKGAPHAG
ncbi:MAG: 1-(5-phosphoribosyl)-5-[(5-phosphoribosylamino)methylideneamino]imidazole-4-carboxamide isomerase [Chloroflexota bacterium]